MQSGNIGGRGAALAIGVVLGLLGFAAGVAFGPAIRRGPEPVAGSGPSSIRSGQEPFLNPLLDCEVGDATPARLLPRFQKLLSAHVRSEIAAGNAVIMGVYFRDLDNGPWFGVNERETFSPASLAKTPVIMACLKQAEEDPGFLQREVLFRGLPPSERLDNYTSEEPLEVGRSYTVEELVRRSAVHSDNHATAMLVQEVRRDILVKLCRDLGIDPELVLDFEKAGGFAPRTYSHFFRVLYNASYLDRKMSAKALALFAESDFADGLVAGVPPGTVVSHKFGVFALRDGEAQLHDCGIVYHPDRPYFLCVMTRGDDEERLAGLIARTSSLVYEAFEGNLRANAPGNRQGPP